MRLFSEEVKITSSNSPLNILQVKDFQEVFFGVFEVQINENKYVAEKISEENGNPIVSILVEEGDEKAQYPFLLLKGKQEIYFNSESEPVEIFESNIENDDDDDLEIREIIEETFDNSEIVEDKKQEILEEIKRVKRNAVKKSLEILEHNKARKIQDIKNEGRKKEKALKEYLESARENLVGEFTIISGKIKNELISDNDYKFDEIRESIDLKIQDIADNLNESLRGNFQNSSKLIDKSVKKLVRELYESNINPKVDKELKDIAEEIVEKVSEIDKNLNNKLNEKADVSLIEGVNRELDAIRDANIELNNSLNKGVQKALSRVGNVDKRILEISEKFDNKISETEQEITQYFDEKLSLVKEETLDITDEARKYFQNLIQESRNGLLSEIRKIKNEKPVEYILESKKGKPIVKDWDTIEKDWNKKIHDKFENYKTDLRKYVAVYASGGGTNATQYQDGGTMNGDLTVVGAISASQYLGLSYLLNDYLPLSGGTVTGNVTVVGGLSADRIYTTQLDALSANITVIDIKQYELSGFNVTGDVTINGSVSAQNISAANLYSNGVQVATVVDPVRTTLTGDGATDTFAISGAGGLVNPSALIVAIDGALQEPGADYGVSGGNITFTSPLANGSKAVVISPVNTVQVGQVVPSDGSVTSAKIANSVTLTTPSLVGPVNLASQDLSTAERVMNRGLFDFRLFEQAEGLWMFRQGDVLTTVTGSGIVDGQGGVSLFSGGTANSVALARIHGGGGLALPMYRLDWSRPLVFSGFILASATTANGISRLLLGVPQATTTPVDLTNKGIGIRCVDSAITLVVHNGSTLTTSATVGTLSSAVQYFRIVCDGTGNVELYLNKVLVASTSLGPTGAAVEVGLTASATNNADAAIQRLLCGLFKIWTL